MAPLVSVICLSFNHARFVREALDSVIGQSWSPIDLIIVDDGSSDNSAAAIEDWLKTHPGVRFLSLKTNHGNCRAFNMALREARGKYVIDLSADDVLVRDRVARGVDLFEKRPEVGVQFSDAELIDESGSRQGFHSDRFPHRTVPQGWVFRDVLARYFINSPTMMMRKSLLDELGGYDESLAYEDFDFWVRSARLTQYAYLPEALVRRRVVRASMGKQQYRCKSTQQWSTLAVCQKAAKLCDDPEDFRALRKRIGFELRQAFLTGDFSLAWRYAQIWLAAAK